MFFSLAARQLPSGPTATNPTVTTSSLALPVLSTGVSPAIVTAPAGGQTEHECPCYGDAAQAEGALGCCHFISSVRPSDAIVEEGVPSAPGEHLGLWPQCER